MRSTFKVSTLAFKTTIASFFVTFLYVELLRFWHNKIPIAIPILIDITLINTIVLNVKFFSIAFGYDCKSMIVF